MSVATLGMVLSVFCGLFAVLAAVVLLAIFGEAVKRYLYVGYRYPFGRFLIMISNPAAIFLWALAAHQLTAPKDWQWLPRESLVWLMGLTLLFMLIVLVTRIRGLRGMLQGIEKDSAIDFNKYK